MIICTVSTVLYQNNTCYISRRSFNGERFKLFSTERFLNVFDMSTTANDVISNNVVS